MLKVHVVCPQCQRRNRFPQERLNHRPRCGACRTPLLPEHPPALTETGFQRYIDGTDLPVVVDFWAPWCGPCKMMGLAFGQAASELGPGIRCVKLNTQDHPAVVQRLGIRGIPTLVLFRDGAESARISGAMAAGQIVDWVRTQAG